MTNAKNILVTGGAGYIGSHACKALSLAGYTPVTVDNLSRGFRSLVQWGPLECGDILDETWLVSVMKRYRPCAVMHFAGLISVAESVREPELYYHHNVAGTLALLTAMRKADVGHLVFSSSCAVHGNPLQLPICEADLCAPIHPYGRSKWIAEQMITDQAAAFGLSAMILRYFNAAGADPDGQIGELHEPETHIIPLAIEAAMTGGTLSLFGTDYPTKDGSAVRDYIHVSDLAEAHVLALQHSLKHGGLHTLNLGTGTGTSVKEMIAAVEKTCGEKLNVQMQPRREGDPAILVAQPEKAQKLLGFTAKRSDITSIVQTAYAWHSKQKKQGA